MRKTPGHFAEAGKCFCPFQESACVWWRPVLCLTCIFLTYMFTSAEMRWDNRPAGGRGGLARPVCFGLNGGFRTSFLYTKLDFFFPPLSPNPIFHLSGQQLNNTVKPGPDWLVPQSWSWVDYSLENSLLWVSNSVAQTCLCLNTYSPPLRSFPATEKQSSQKCVWESGGLRIITCLCFHLT